jgi:hypothetical protein
MKNLNFKNFYDNFSKNPGIERTGTETEDFLGTETEI